MRVRRTGPGYCWRRKNSVLSWTVWGEPEKLVATVVFKRSISGAREGGQNCLKSENEANMEERDQESPGPEKICTSESSHAYHHWPVIYFYFFEQCELGFLPIAIKGLQCNINTT